MYWSYGYYISSFCLFVWKYESLTSFWGIFNVLQIDVVDRGFVQA